MYSVLMEGVAQESSTHPFFCYITQYGSTVYIGIAMVYSHKHFVHFHSQFEVDFTFNDIKVKNM